MTILSRVFASDGPEVLIETLQVNAGKEEYRLTKGFDDITATLENGDLATFEGCGMDVALPARNGDGTQDLKFAISNIDGVVSTAIRNALEKEEAATLTYRSYLSTDLDAPAAVPFTLAIKNGSWTSTEVQITAGYMNVLDTLWPRRRYTLYEFPGLRYIS